MRTTRTLTSIACLAFLCLALVPAPPAAAGIGCSNSSWGTSTSCPFSCNAGDYLRVKAENTNGGYVRGSIACADQSAGCGAYGTCTVTTIGTTSYAQSSNNCYAERDNMWGSVKVACQAKAHPSHFTIGSSMVREVVILIIDDVAFAQSCAGPTEDALSCVAVVPVCDVRDGRTVCRA